jgi:hypothetical protein
MPNLSKKYSESAFEYDAIVKLRDQTDDDLATLEKKLKSQNEDDLFGITDTEILQTSTGDASKIPYDPLGSLFTKKSSNADLGAKEKMILKMRGQKAIAASNRDRDMLNDVFDELEQENTKKQNKLSRALMMGNLTGNLANKEVVIESKDPDNTGVRVSKIADVITGESQKTGVKPALGGVMADF